MLGWSAIADLIFSAIDRQTSPATRVIALPRTPSSAISPWPEEPGNASTIIATGLTAGCKVGRKPWEPAGLNELTPGVTGIGVELVRRAADDAVPVELVGQSRIGLHSEIFLEE